MSKVALLEEEVKKLSGSEVAEFRGWYLEYDDGCWQREIAADAENGRLDDLAVEAVADYKKGNFREL